MIGVAIEGMSWIPEALAAQVDVLRQDYDHVRQMLDDLRQRVRDATAEAAIVHGLGSPEHLRLRYALSGEGEGRPRPEILQMARGPGQAEK